MIILNDYCVIICLMGYTFELIYIKKYGCVIVDNGKYEMSNLSYKKKR